MHAIQPQKALFYRYVENLQFVYTGKGKFTFC